MLFGQVHVRQLVLDAVEEQFDRPCQVFVEHTSLISWGPGASIGWHHDSNRVYLAQRHFSAVLYLNTQDIDFTGGTFCFQSGWGPLRIEPRAGMLLVYTADERNVHQVEPVTSGERSTLTMWLTLDAAHQEDKKVLAALSSPAMRGSGLPPTMYQQTPDGPDIRLALLQQLGVELVSSQQGVHAATVQQQQQELEELDGQGQQRQQQQQQHIEPQKNRGHPGSKQQSTVVAARQQCSRPVVRFSNIQHAALVLYMLQQQLCPHKKPPSPAAGSGEVKHSSHVSGCGSSAASPAKAPTQQPQQQAFHCGCNCYTDPKLLSRAGQLLHEYLHAAGEQLEHLLPVWRQLGALVPPAASKQHVVADCC